MLRSRAGAPAVVATVGGTFFVLARLIVAAHGDIAVFIVAGSAHVDAAAAPRGLPIIPGSGYDGQFYYRMALDPADLQRVAFGIRLDTIGRLQRIGYPAIAWVLAAGQPAFVPTTLVVTNVAMLGALGLGGGLIALDGHRHALWGLVLPGYWGYLWSVGRDLTEVTAAAFLVLGLVALRRGRLVLCAALVLAAVLSKETEAYLVAVMALTGLVVARSRHRRSLVARQDLALLVPLLGFAVWQVLVWAATGHVPLLDSGGANIGIPLAGLVPAAGHYLATLSTTKSLLWCGELVVLLVLSTAAAMAVARSRAPLYEKVAWGAALVLAACASKGIWLGDVGFRSLDTVFVFDWLVLLGLPGRDLRRLWAISAATWLVVLVELVVFV